MHQSHPTLRPWSRVWRYLVAGTAGAMAWTAWATEQLSVPLTAAQEDTIGAVLLLDFVLGVAGLAVLTLRRRHPLAVAILTTSAMALSATCMGPAALAIVSMATWRRRGWVAATGAGFLGCQVLSEVLYWPRFSFVDDSVYTSVGSIVLGLMFFAAAVITGFYIAARRELVASLYERVLIAEREQALTTKVARDAERTRIAQEMHDVLAHRISLVALHAGALAYREDLSRAQTSETAQTIQANARLALSELREVLGVLRSGTADVERPQPTLAELPALLADAREAGSTVLLDTSGLPGERLPALPETLSRTSFRIVQETLTNARKHAPGQPVMVRLSGTPGGLLEIEVRNPIGDGVGLDLPSAGVGLAGLTERASLAGGALEYGPGPDGTFLVRARLPWPS
ncbi:putative two-component system sensor kinase [Alloactinosynnema sp. L-07]|uniref:sensor histidine kinase n=1 Tax=Alloactinosynnema sp. L-07 TaxID=1653480 RepID=UPI00065EFA49|nr:histidine kinase [Alloactinosynnema sp. L-07]CRK56282.1 putative two-component system sensor kinase [Alloactinosynnema sp. L-07]